MFQAWHRFFRCSEPAPVPADRPGPRSDENPALLNLSRNSIFIIVFYTLHHYARAYPMYGSYTAAGEKTITM